MMEMQENQNQIAIPPNLICPITHELMEDPVMAADSHTYEREAIETWLNSGRNTSPYTGALLRDRKLQPNHSLKTVIIDFKESIPTLERQQQIATDFEEACRLREKEINEALVKPSEEDLRKLYEKEQAKNERLSQQLEEMQKKLEQMQPTGPNMNNNDVSLSITPESRLHFLRKTNIRIIPSQSTRDPINLKDIVQRASFMRGDNDAWAITRWFSGHYYLFFRTEHYYLTLELRKSLCKIHKKKGSRYIFTNDISLACSDCRKKKEKGNPSEVVVERYDRKSLVDFLIQNKPTDAPSNPSKEVMSRHLSQQDIFERYYPCVVETWTTRKHLTIGDLLTKVEELTEKDYGFLSFNCRDFAQDLQEFTKSQ